MVRKTGVRGGEIVMMCSLCGADAVKATCLQIVSTPASFAKEWLICPICTDLIYQTSRKLEVI